MARIEANPLRKRRSESRTLTASAPSPLRRPAWLVAVLTVAGAIALAVLTSLAVSAWVINSPAVPHKISPAPAVTEAPADRDTCGPGIPC
jgi:hypothetical protein